MNSPDIPQVGGESDLPIPAQIEDATGFLTFLFGEIARSPQKLNMMKTAKAVALLLRLIAVGRRVRNSDPDQELADHELKQQVLDMAGLILISGVQNSDVKPSDSRRAQIYLDHIATYVTHPYMDRVRQLLEDFEIPADAPDFERPRLLSKSMSIHWPARQPPQPQDAAEIGEIKEAVKELGGNRDKDSPKRPSIPAERDDLSERIYVAYHLLRTYKNHRKMIASALETAKIPQRIKRPSQNGKSKAEWDPDDVSDRAKKYEARFTKRLGISDPNNVARCRRTLLCKWVEHFSHYQMLRSELDAIL